MTSRKKISNKGFVALVALGIFNPITALAQSLAVTCDSGSFLGLSLCNDEDMTAVETAVNHNESDIALNAAGVAAAQSAADAAQSTADGAVATNITQQGEIDANTAGVAAAQSAADAAQSTADGAVATNITQQGEIDANTAGVATNITNIQTNADNIGLNAGNIAINTAGIATNAADIIDLQDDLADLRTDVNQGLAMANAMEVFAPDPGTNFRLNIGTGFQDSEVAFGVTASGRVGASGGTVVYLGVAASEDTTAGKAGVSFQW